MLSLVDLPVELLLDIHLLSLSSSLPQVSRSFHQLFSTSSTFHKASYLILRHPSHKSLSHAIRYPICTLPVLESFERIHSIRGVGKLKCRQLPRRLFSSLTPSPSPSQSNPNRHYTLIQYLLEEYQASPNSHTGYPLARAVFAGDLKMIQLLLKHGADPGLKQGWAVVTAIMSGSTGTSTSQEGQEGEGKGTRLELVRGLIERGYPLPYPPQEEEKRESLGNDRKEKKHGKKQKKRKRVREEDDDSSKKNHKKVKFEDRCKPTAEMLEIAVKTKQWDIVDYLTKKGATPNLNVLKLL
ncbi:hypothetical protein JCM5353_001856 [Sporobolomyces roseus]